MGRLRSHGNRRGAGVSFGRKEGEACPDRFPGLSWDPVPFHLSSVTQARDTHSPLTVRRTSVCTDAGLSPVHTPTEICTLHHTQTTVHARTHHSHTEICTHTRAHHLVHTDTCTHAQRPAYMLAHTTLYTHTCTHTRAHHLVHTHTHVHIDRKVPTHAQRAGGRTRTSGPSPFSSPGLIAHILEVPTWLPSQIIVFFLICIYLFALF